MSLLNDRHTFRDYTDRDRTRTFDHGTTILYKLATLYRQVGRVSDAEEVEAELRALVAVADDDHPVKRRLRQ